MIDWHRIICPAAWIQNYPTSMEWDAALNLMMDNKFPVKRISELVIELGSSSIWIGNYPYAFGHPYPEPEVLPKVKTRKRLMAYISAYEIASYLAQQEETKSTAVINKGANQWPISRRAISFLSATTPRHRGVLLSSTVGHAGTAWLKSIYSDSLADYTVTDFVNPFLPRPNRMEANGWSLLLGT